MKESIWTRDITHEIIGTLAVFGLVVSSLVTGLGVAAVGVRAQVALAQYGSAATQTASVVSAEVNDTHPAPAAMGMGSSTMRDVSTDHHGDIQAASVLSNASYCPKIAKTIARGSREASTTGDVGELQRFIANRYGLNPADVATGYFGSTTASYLEKFQQEQGIAPYPSAGPLTRAAIFKLCAGASAQMRELHPPATGSSTKSMMGSTTMPRPPMPPEPPHPSPSETSASPVTMQEQEGASNTAAVLSAIAQISDGYGKLTGALLSLVGL